MIAVEMSSGELSGMSLSSTLDGACRISLGQKYFRFSADFSDIDRMLFFLSALEAAGVEPVLHLIEKFTAPYQLPVIARSADA